jgi:hypothetical protein
MTTSEITTSKIMTMELNEFDRRVLLLIDCGMMKDKNWLDKEVKKKTKFFKNCERKHRRV